MRYFLLLVMALLVAEATTAQASTRPAVQCPKPLIAAPPDTKIGPVYLNYDSQSVSVVSPNGKFAVTVTGEKTSLGAWVTVDEFTHLPRCPGLYLGLSTRVWPIERNVKVLWRPDSRAFALTDNRYANESYVLIIGTKFHWSGPTLGIQRVDVTPILRKAFDKHTREYYQKYSGKPDYESDAFYTKALRWVSNEQLMVGVAAITAGGAIPKRVLPTDQRGNPPGVRGWCLGYILDVLHGKILRRFSKEAVQTQYGFKCPLQD